MVLVATALDGEVAKVRDGTGRVSKDKQASMCSRIVLVGTGWCAEDGASSNGKVLAQLMMPLWIEMGFSKDVDARVPAPVPLDNLSTHVGHIAKVQHIVSLFISCLLQWARMQGWVIVGLLCRGSPCSTCCGVLKMSTLTAQTWVI